MKIALGNDHIVTDVKNRLKDWLISQGHDVMDVGTFDSERTHYPIYGRKAAHLVASGQADRAIVLCGTGVGISNSANKVNGIRCILAGDPALVRHARQAYDINALAVGGRVSGMGMIEELADAFLNTDYEGNNDALIEKIDQLQFESDAHNDSLFDPYLEKWQQGFYHD